ncbi:MAG TPA: ADP-ribosylglycohydrolase family protein, partial [Gammaproteobacteria bacterium]|nr:ADP-ribosylglycohydrolase family protein [Gammaproteobacteria bacterium]
LGRGWIAEEALAIALYCALSAPNLEEALILAVNHDGDSDSTGAITGNILGTVYGEEAIPQRWRDDLELQEVIREMAEDLYGFPDWKVSEYGDEAVNDYYWGRYPGY